MVAPPATLILAPDSDVSIATNKQKSQTLKPPKKNGKLKQNKV